jgi:hypothetical protein
MDNLCKKMLRMPESVPVMTKNFISKYSHISGLWGRNLIINLA